ncbi:MAG: hypothetical protein WC349_04325 [Patescibacteria group bacterium]|jgi:hypothetical protein
MKKNNIKGIIIFSLTLIIIFILATWLYAPVIFQEGNPVPYLKGAWQLNLSQKDIIKLDVDGDRYMTKNRNGLGAITELMKSQNYEFVEQLGAGYFYKSSDKAIVLTRRQYSRFYVIWTINESGNVNNLIDWLDYKNDEFSFTLRYPSLSVDNQLWGNLSETLPSSEILLPNQILSKGNNFYLHQKYSLVRDQQTGIISKTENTFIPEYDGSYSYPTPWHIVIFNVKDKNELEKIIKTKLGPGCSYKTKISTEFKGNYRVEINGDGKDLGETLCPVNYANYIIYSPDREKVAFWSIGQECQIGLGFMFENCFDKKISDSFHFTEENLQVPLSTPTGIIKEQLDNRLE